MELRIFGHYPFLGSPIKERTKEVSKEATFYSKFPIFINSKFASKSAMGTQYQR